jgi:serine/threonine protein kinase
MDAIAIEREIKIHKNLNHPHIIKLYDAFLEGKYIYIILEYMENGNIFRMMRENQLPEELIIRIMSQMLSAVSYFHNLKIIHRDIKPENILWNKSMTFKMSDFGFSAGYLEKSGRKTMCGTTEYLAPEVIKNMYQDDKLDIWCLGILLYELVYRRTPFDARNTYTLLKDIESRKVEYPPYIKKEFQQFCELCLIVDQHKRPSAQYLLENFPIFRLKDKKRESVNPIPMQMPKPVLNTTPAKKVQETTTFKKKSNVPEFIHDVSQQDISMNKPEFNNIKEKMFSTGTSNHYKNNISYHNTQTASKDTKMVPSPSNKKPLYVFENKAETQTNSTKVTSTPQVYLNSKTSNDISNKNMILLKEESPMRMVNNALRKNLDSVEKYNQESNSVNKNAPVKKQSVNSTTKFKIVSEPVKFNNIKTMGFGHDSNQAISYRTTTDSKSPINVVNVYSKGGYDPLMAHAKATYSTKTVPGFYSEKKGDNSVTRKAEYTPQSHMKDTSIDKGYPIFPKKEEQKFQQNMSQNKNGGSDNFYPIKTKSKTQLASFDLFQTAPLSANKVTMDSGDKAKRMLIYDNQREEARKSQNDDKPSDRNQSHNKYSTSHHSSHNLSYSVSKNIDTKRTTNTNNDISLDQSTNKARVQLMKGGGSSPMTQHHSIKRFLPVQL